MYTHDQGRISGTLNAATFSVEPVGGNVFAGTWNEAPTRTGPNDAGPVEFKATRDGKSFKGRRAYAGSATSWHTLNN